MRRNPLANANGFANEMAKISFSLRKFLANGRLRQNSLAIANAMAWCTQAPTLELGSNFGGKGRVLGVCFLGDFRLLADFLASVGRGDDIFPLTAANCGHLLQNG